MYTYHIRLNSS